MAEFFIRSHAADLLRKETLQATSLRKIRQFVEA
jgi:hypothetical protein